jgi:hypothetical protein
LRTEKDFRQKKMPGLPAIAALSSTPKDREIRVKEDIVDSTQ